VPRFFTGLLASGVDDEQVLLSASQEVRLVSAKTRAHKRRILIDYSRLWILSVNLEERGEEALAMAAEARQALARRAGDLVEDLWSGVDRIARALPEADRQRYLAWIIDELGGDWAGNPARACRQTGLVRLEMDPDLAADFTTIESRLTEIEARIIRHCARSATADEQSQGRIAREYHDLCDERYRLLDELAAVLRAASQGVDADDLPAEWQLIELICSEPREVWRRLQQSIDFALHVSSVTRAR
jgi:hypothetical protein